MMRSNSNELLNELNTRCNEYSESKLAILLLNHLHHFDSVKRVSANIVELIHANEAKVLDIIDTTPAIKHELKLPYFGACLQEGIHYTSSDILNKILNILSDGFNNYSSIMQIHCIFIHRIYDHIHPGSRAELCQRVFPDSLITEKKCSRREHKEKTILATRQLGISRNPVFAKMLGKSAQVHARAMDRFIFDSSTNFFKAAAIHQTPVVCGPSGHTRTLLLGAMLYGKLDVAEMKQYVLAIFSFLASGGNHSLHEVLVVAEEAAVGINKSNYLDFVPEVIMEIKSAMLFP